MPVLNIADAVYAGTGVVQAVYYGSTEVYNIGGSVIPGVNLSPNPSAGADLTGWNGPPWSGSTLQQTTGLTEFSRPTGVEMTAMGYTQTPLALVDGGTEYTYRIEVLPPTTVTDQVVWLDWFDVTSDLVDTVRADQQTMDFPGGEVTTLVWTETSPADAQSVFLAFNSGLPVGTILTAVRLSPGTDSRYADGESPSWDWDGTRYNSTSSLIT